MHVINLYSSVYQADSNDYLNARKRKTILIVVINMGKGSKRRPENNNEYQKAWERIWGNDKKKRVQERRTRKQQKNI